MTDSQIYDMSSSIFFFLQYYHFNTSSREKESRPSDTWRRLARNARGGALGGTWIWLVVVIPAHIPPGYVLIFEFEHNPMIFNERTSVRVPIGTFASHTWKSYNRRTRLRFFVDRHMQYATCDIVAAATPVRDNFGIDCIFEFFLEPLFQEFNHDYHPSFQNGS